MWKVKSEEKACPTNLTGSVNVLYLSILKEVLKDTKRGVLLFLLFREKIHIIWPQI